MRKDLPKPRGVLKVLKERRQNHLPAQLGRDHADDCYALDQPHKHVRFQVFGEHDQELDGGQQQQIYKGELGDTYFRGVVKKQVIQHVVEQLDKEKVKWKNVSWSKRSRNSSPSECTFLNSSSSGSNSDTSSPADVNTSGSSHTRTCADIFGIQRLFQIDLRVHRHAVRTGQSTNEPLSSSPEQERIQRLFEDDLHRKKLDLKRRRYLALQNYSDFSRILREWGMKRITEEFTSRIKSLNDRVTTLSRRRSGTIET